MKFEDRLKFESIPGIKQFKGHAQLDLLRNGKVVKRIEKDNTITPALNALLHNQFIGNEVGIGRSFSANDYFGGCFLLDGEIPFSDGVPPTTLPSNLNITAHAGQQPNMSATIIKRGSPNLAESHEGDNNSYTFVWDWKTSEGIGDIAALALTHATNGYNGLGTNEDGLKAAILLPNTSIAFKDLYNTVDNSLTGAAAIIFNEDNTYWAIKYNNKVFTFEKRVRSISLFRFNDNRTIETHTAETSYDFPFTSSWTFTTMSVDNGYAYFFYCPNNRHLRYCKISLADFSVVDQEIEFTFNIGFGEPYASSWNVNQVIVINGSLYFYNNANAKVYKVDLNNIADIVEIENLDGININITYGQGNFFKSGALIGLMASNNGFGILNDRIIRLPGDNFDSAGDRHIATAYANFDGAITKVTGANNINQVLAPNLITTALNLSGKVTKGPDMTMKLSYTISEA